MQLNNINKRRLFPLTLTCGVMASSFVFSYSSIGSNISSDPVYFSSIEGLIQEGNSYYYSKLSMKSQFEKRLLAWKKKTRFMSFADQIVNDSNFRYITNMGEEVVPLILEEIEKEPSPLVWSLNIIYNKTISNNPLTTIEQACKLWLKELS
ncbi:MAG: hypothetical protein WCP85_30590 [Mariniphaga sp.]